MKFNFIIIILLSFLKVHAQKDSLLPFEEFSISINHTILADNNTIDKTGFGVGAYHLTKSGKIINVKFGLEYNRTSIFKKYEYSGHFSNTTNITYNYNTLSIPILANLSFGKKTIIFFETGPYIDINVSGRSKGTMNTYAPYQVYQQSTHTEKVAPSIDYGIALGIGIRQRIAKHEIIIKPDFKYGLKYLNKKTDSFCNRYVRIIVGIRI
jgi:hypothetical protein